MTKKINSVLVLTNYRSGSTTFTIQEAERRGLPYCGEILLRKFALGSAPAGSGSKRMLQELQSGAQGVFKIMPNQCPAGELAEWIAHSDHIIYLYRRDFQAQVLSWVGATKAGDWGKNGFANSGKTPRERHMGEYGKTVEHHLQLNQADVNHKVNQLKNNWLTLGQLYAQHPGELVCYEDYFSGENYKPYNRKYHWQGTASIPEFDVASLFEKENTHGNQSE